MENKQKFDDVDVNRIYNALNYYCHEVGSFVAVEELRALKELRNRIGKTLGK